MPATSPKMQRYMGMCSHANNPPKSCPPPMVAREFSFKPKKGYSQAQEAKEHLMHPAVMRK